MGKEGRSTVYNQIVTTEKLAQVNPDNTELMNDFLDYLVSIDRSPQTVSGYKNDLKIFFVWNLENNKNKYFVDLTKREISKFQSYAINELGWSGSRIRRVKSSMSSMSNYIETILDDEIEDFRSIINKIESPSKEPVREKTVLSDEEVEDLLNKLVETKKYQQACAVALAVYSGARKSELTRFKVNYFNEENIIFNAMWKTPEKIKTKGRGGKMGKPLTKYILLDFKKYLNLWLNQRKELGIESEWLLVTKENGEYVQAKVSTMDSFAETCSKLMDKPFYFHCLRHQLCTKLSKYNLPPSIIQEYFGWASTDLISVYDDSEAIDDFGKYFSADGIISQEQKGLADL